MDSRGFVLPLYFVRTVQRIFSGSHLPHYAPIRRTRYPSTLHRCSVEGRRFINRRFAKVEASLSLAARIAKDNSFDERIGTEFIRIPDELGQLGPAQRLKSVLSQLDRSKEHLRQLGEHADGTPICRIVTKDQIRREEETEQAIAKRKDARQLSKQIELNWAAAENDIKHRMKLLQEFLSEGRAVEILIAPKKKGRRAETEEVDSLLQRINESAMAIEGVTNWKETEGEAGKMMQMSFKPPSRPAIVEVEKLKAKQARKETEEQERLEKEERRQQRREAQAQRRAKIAASLGVPTV